MSRLPKELRSKTAQAAVVGAWDEIREARANGEKVKPKMVGKALLKSLFGALLQRVAK